MRAECSVSECQKRVNARGLCSMHYYRLRKHGNEHTVLRVMGDPVTSFWAKVDKSEDCWNWTASLSLHGYGQIKMDGKMRRSHRIAYELLVGPIPAGADIDHTCHNRRCVNPRHLRPTTRKQNMENRSKSSFTASGIRGVTWDSSAKKWSARVCHNGVVHRLGMFESKEEAGLVAKAKRIELFTHNDEDRKTA